MRYRSKLAFVEAWKYDGTAKSAYEILGVAYEYKLDLRRKSSLSDFIVVTNNGPAELKVGHYLVKGPYDFYPCDPDTFKSRWELADTQNSGDGNF